ncbi:DUF2256 domain-containing protein [Agrobacterium larrymoorei]|uniref:DUF2256 domain-containing protein n=1 Tax=Agrobacterium larrymoorei TaxID=160699 RepID=UPI0030BDA394
MWGCGDPQLMIQLVVPALSWRKLRGFPVPKQRKKSELPSKICPVCGRPFVWRKKWAKDWENVKFCSERCREAKRGVATDLSPG